MSDSCALSDAEIRKQGRIYEDLHEGLPAKKVLCENISGKPSSVNVLGRITEIQYLKMVPEGEPHYWHPFEDHAQPKFGFDPSGKLRIYSGRYIVTSHGIEDRRTNAVRRESLPRTPRKLTTLGKLEWLKYRWYDNGIERISKLRFPSSSPPLLTHDESGNLHVIKGHYRITGQGVDTMARRRSRRSHRSHLLMHENPRRSHRRSRRSRRSGFKMFRLNPTSSKSLDRAQRGIAATMVVGLSATASLVAIDSLVNYFGAPTLAAGTTPGSAGWTPTIKALAKIGVGLGAGWLTGEYTPAPASVAMGVGLGGVISGARDLYIMYIQPNVPAQLQLAPNPPMNAPMGTANTPLGGAQQALLPGGMPRGYAPMTAAQCAVPVR